MKKLIVMMLAGIALHIQCISQQRYFDQPLELKDCKVSIVANAFVATTDLELEFYNPKDSVVEGTQYFSLSRGQVITGFQLELNGKFRDGSIEERRKARVAYSSIVGKRIDPALLQMYSQDMYSLNIYPVPAHGSRKVSIKILQLMKADVNGIHYKFPVAFTKKAGSFSLDIDLHNNGMQVKTNTGLLQDKYFASTNSAAKLHYSDTELLLNKEIAFYLLPEKDKPQICISKTNGETNFLLRFLPATEKNYLKQARSLAVFWDVSASSANRNIKQELSYLERFINTNKIEYAKIILFNQQLQGTIEYFSGTTSFSYIKAYLENYDYTGATQLGNLDLSVPNTDIVLLFTDGINSYGKAMPRQGLVPVNCIISGDEFNDRFLSKIVSTTGGQVIHLYKNNITDAVTKTDNAENYLMSYRSMNNVTTINEQFPLRLGEPLLLSGRLTGPDTLALIFGNDHSINAVQKFFLPMSEAACEPELMKQITLLREYDSIMYTRDNQFSEWDKQLYFGLKHKVMTTQTAFLVLERVEDYIRYRIAPPKDLEQQCAEMNYVYNNEYMIKLLREQDQTQILKDVAENYNDKIKWWDKTLQPIDLARPIVITETRNNSGGTASNVQTTAQVNNTMNPLVNEAKELTTVVVTGIGTIRGKSSMGYATSVIKNMELTSVNPVNIQNGLTAKVSGLNVQTTNSSVFSNTRITLRGARSLTGNNQPLLVLDGMPIDFSLIAAINPNDISSVTVLKSSSSAAIYGSQGVNGAIVLTSKKGRYYYYNYEWREYKLSDIDDVEYMHEIKNADRNNLWDAFKELEKAYAEERGFYFDMADYFFEMKQDSKAMSILYSAAESMGDNVKGKRAIAWQLEKWKKFDEAIVFYEAIIAADNRDLSVKRDLALAYYQKGLFQRSVDAYYSIISSESPYNFYDPNRAIKDAAMAEMNAVIALHRSALDLSRINSNLVRPLPVDIRISVEGNNQLYNFQVQEPGGEIASYNHQYTKSGGYFMHAKDRYYYEQPEQYEIKHALAGKYRVKINAYNNFMYQKDAPAMVRIITFKNFQKEGQSLEIENVIVDNQYGVVEIGNVNW